ncbi:MAG: hypothetical protein ACRESR_02655 [Gammaproteobacteria bacterium]
MNDCLQPAGRISRIACCVASGIAAVASGFLSALLWADMIREGRFTFGGKPLWVSAVVLTAISITAAFITYRLARGRNAPNGVTILPSRFIESFGVFFLLVVVIVAYDRGDWMFAAKASSVGLAMVFVGRNSARRKNTKPNGPQ